MRFGRHFIPSYGVTKAVRDCPTRVDNVSITFEIRSYPSKAVSYSRWLTFPVQAFFNVPQWWQAMGRRSTEMPQEPESEDEASVDAEESQRDQRNPRGVDVIILCPRAAITLGTGQLHEER